MRGRMCLVASFVGIALFSFSPGALSLGSSNPAALHATDKQDLNLLSKEAVPTSTRVAQIGAKGCNQHHGIPTVPHKIDILERA